jgi:DNA-binding NtrC family response regulator
VDVRLVSATNRDLFALTAAGAFRRDLYYRLSGATLHIPPLRQRPDDIPALVEYFGARYAASARAPRPEFHAEAMAALQAHPWPGNARELKNVVHRAAVLARGRVVQVADLRLEAGPEAGTFDSVTNAAQSRLAETSEWQAGSMDSTKDVSRTELLRQEVARAERARIVEALARAHGNQVVAARLLGVSRRTLINRLEAYQIPRPRKGQQ